MPTVSNHSNPTANADIDASIPNVLVRQYAHKRPSTDLYHTNVAQSVTCLETQLLTIESVTALHKERRADLRSAVASLEDDVESLESANRSLKQTIEQKNQQINQIIDNYETIIDAKDREYRNLRDDHTSDATVGSLHTALVERLK